MKRLIVLFPCVLTCAVVLCGVDVFAALSAGHQRSGRGAAAAPAARSAQASAPPIRVVDLKGLDAAITQYRGKAILLNFWAIWCQPCVEELPRFLDVGRAYRDRNAVALTVSYDLMIPDVTKDGVLKQMRAFVAQRKIDAPVFIYDAPDYDAINERFGLPGPVPVTIAIDAGGAIVARHAGQATREQFEELMRKALGATAY